MRIRNLKDSRRALMPISLSSSFSLLDRFGDFQTATAKINNWRALARAWVLKNPRVQAVNDESALFFHLHQASVPQDSKVVRDIDHFRLEVLCQIGNIPRTLPQTLDNAQTVGVGNSAKQPSTTIRFQWIFHAGSILFFERNPVPT
jgi:hypothetical protein